MIRSFLFVVVTFGIFSTNSGCQSGHDLMNQAREEKTYTVTLVVFDFYNENTRLTINGVEEINAVLKVEDNNSTGLNFTREVKLSANNVFHLYTDKIDSEYSITVNENTKLIYIQPSYEPYIDTSDSDVILLD